MGVFARLKRSLRAMFGSVVEKTEDPEQILPSQGLSKKPNKSCGAASS